jgi:anti-sigma factor RsiW
MACLNDGMLRAQIDGELSENQQLELKEHFASCADCRQRAEAIAQSAERVARSLTALAPVASESSADARAAIAGFRTRRAAVQSAAPSVARILFGRPAWMMLAAASLIIGVLAFTPARSWAQRLVAMLRVQKITAVPLDFEALDNPSDRARLGKSIAQLLSEEVVVTVKPGEPQQIMNRAEATQAAGFQVRLPGNRADAPQLEVFGEQAFHMTVDRDRLQSLLEEGGRSDLQLPYSLDGATIAAQIPKVVLAEYGSCRHRGHDALPAEVVGGLPCIQLVQAPSPTVTVPPELNLAEIAEFGLQLGGMSAEAARGFSRTVDWASTLVLGIPQGSSYRTVEVDGAQGTLIERAGRGEKIPARYWLLWTKGGMIYSLRGSGDPTDALTLAESLN